MLKPWRRTASTSLRQRLVARRVVPAQRAKALLDLGPRMLAEGGEAAAGGADQRGEAAADIDMQAHRRLAARQRHHDHVLEVGQLDADRGDAVAAATASSSWGCTRLGKSPFSSDGARQRQHADAEAVLLGQRVDLHQLLGDQRAQDVQRRAGHQAERLRRSPSRRAASRLRPSRRRMATARVTAGTARTRGIGRSVMIVSYTINRCRIVQSIRAGRPSMPAMTRLTDYTSYADAQAHFSPAEAVGAVRRRPRAAEHRPRVHRPACRPIRPRRRASSRTPTGATRC